MIEKDIQDLQEQVRDLTDILRNFIALQGAHSEDCVFLTTKRHIESREVDSMCDRDIRSDIRLYCCCKQKEVHSKKCHAERMDRYYLKDIEDSHCSCGAAKIKQLLENR